MLFITKLNEITHLLQNYSTSGTTRKWTDEIDLKWNYKQVITCWRKTSLERYHNWEPTQGFFVKNVHPHIIKQENLFFTDTLHITITKTLVIMTIKWKQPKTSIHRVRLSQQGKVTRLLALFWKNTNMMFNEDLQFWRPPVLSEHKACDCSFIDFNVSAFNLHDLLFGTCHLNTILSQNLWLRWLY